MYGLDVKILSPPHAVLAAGSFGIASGEGAPACVHQSLGLQCYAAVSRDCCCTLGGPSGCESLLLMTAVLGRSAVALRAVLHRRGARNAGGARAIAVASSHRWASTIMAASTSPSDRRASGFCRSFLPSRSSGRSTNRSLTSSRGSSPSWSSCRHSRSIWFAGARAPGGGSRRGLATAPVFLIVVHCRPMAVCELSDDPACEKPVLRHRGTWTSALPRSPSMPVTNSTPTSPQRRSGPEYCSRHSCRV